MYNRYIPNGTAYTRVLEDDGPPLAPPVPPVLPGQEPSVFGDAPPEPDPVPPEEPGGQTVPPQTPPPDPPPQKPKKAGLSGLLKGLKLEDLDTGDLLLLLILLFLFLEGDDTELLITLGLLLVLGLD